VFCNKFILSKIIILGTVSENAILAAREIRDVVEHRQGQSDFGEIVDFVVPKFCQLLLHDGPLFIAELPHQRLRKLILETIFRLPATDPKIKQHEREISTLCFSLIETDNEENVQG